MKLKLPRFYHRFPAQPGVSATVFILHHFLEKKEKVHLFHGLSNMD